MTLLPTQWLLHECVRYFQGFFLTWLPHLNSDFSGHQDKKMNLDYGTIEDYVKKNRRDDCQYVYDKVLYISSQIYQLSMTVMHYWIPTWTLLDYGKISIETATHPYVFVVFFGTLLMWLCFKEFQRTYVHCNLMSWENRPVQGSEYGYT